MICKHPSAVDHEKMVSRFFYTFVEFKNKMDDGYEFPWGFCGLHGMVEVYDEEGFLKVTFGVIGTHLYRFTPYETEIILNDSKDMCPLWKHFASRKMNVKKAGQAMMKVFVVMLILLLAGNEHYDTYMKTCEDKDRPNIGTFLEE